MIEIMVDLQGGESAPLYEKIYEYIKKDIINGRISQGERLPSTRLLAKNLAVSRSTVEMAYDQLLAEGYIKAEPCRGFFVCDISELYRIGEAGAGDWREEDWADAKTEPEIDFSPYAIDTQSFPFGIWRRLSKNVLPDDREELLYAGDGQGAYELRSAIAGYLHQARGVNCRVSDIVIGAGNEYLEILLAQLLGRGKRVLMEDPGYPQAYRTFCNMGYEVRTVPAGERQLNREAVLAENPELIYMMPSHQFPLGTVMPLKQRLELLQWASEEKGRYLIEDDHDSEYRYRGKPIPSLQSIDSCGKVIYLGTFSKSIAPSLRISYMVLPPELLSRYKKECGFYSATVPRMQQELLKNFMEGGYFERHLNKMRGIYRGKRDLLLGLLKEYPWVEQISGDRAGLHLLVRIKTSLSEERLCSLARERGVGVTGISQYYLKRAREEREKQPVILFGYGNLSGEEMERGLRVLDTVLREQ